MRYFKLKETTTAEIYNDGDRSDPSTMHIRYNGKNVKIKDFLKRAKFDASAKTLLGSFKQLQKEKGMTDISLLEFLSVYFGDDDNFLDYINKDGVEKTDGYGKSHHYDLPLKVDDKEFDKNLIRFAPMYKARAKQNIGKVVYKDDLEDLIVNIDV